MKIVFKLKGYCLNLKKVIEDGAYTEAIMFKLKEGGWRYFLNRKGHTSRLEEQSGSNSLE